MSELMGIVSMVVFAVILVSFLKKKADNVNRKKELEERQKKQRIANAKTKAESDARKEFTEKVNYYIALYGEDRVRPLIDEYGEDFEDFIDELED